MVRPRHLFFSRSFVAKSFCDAREGPPTAEAALSEAVERLRAACVPDAEASAGWLLAHVLGSTTMSAVDVAVAEGSHLTELQAGRFRAFVARRETREPTQYIVGKWAFYDIEVEVRPPVLVPRPETEELVDLILKWWFSDISRRSRPARFLDVGCGSGCIGLALLQHLPRGSECLGIDISQEALSLANHNGLQLVDRRCKSYEVKERSAAVPRPRSEKPYDFIVSNPPYIPTCDLKGLEPEVRHFEDPRALDGGDDGLDVARHILDQAPTYLDPKSTRTLWLELDTSHPLTLPNEINKKRPTKASSFHNSQQMRLDASFKDANENSRFAKILFDTTAPSSSSSEHLGEETT